MTETSTTHHKIKAEWTKSSKKEVFENSSIKSDNSEIAENKSEICEKQTKVNDSPEKIEILEQIVIYPSQKSVKCHYCDKNFDKSALEEHQKTHEKTFFDCTDCEKKFRRKSSLRKHINFTHKGKFKYECKDCSVTFIDLTKFELHNNTKHKTDSTQKKYRCQDPDCNKSFASSEYLKRHQVTHNDEFKYECSVCDQKFKWMTSLQVHEMSHTQNRAANECNVCFKSFFNSRTLERHQKIHKNVKFRCNLCEKVVSNRRDNIRRHIRHIHADVERTEIAGLIETISEPERLEVVSAGLDRLPDDNEQNETPHIAKAIEKLPSPSPIINSRVETVIQTVGNPNKLIVVQENLPLLPQKPQETEIKLPPKKKAIALSQTTSTTQITMPKYDPIEHYRKILGFSKEDDHPPPTEDNTEDDEMEQEAQVFPVHWRKRTSQNFLFRR